MIVRSTILFSLLLSAVALHAQNTNDTLHWNAARALTRADFKQEPQDFTGLAGEAYCMILANYERSNAFSRTTYHAVAIFERTKSWVGSEVKEGDLLAYFQVLFDLYELHARELKKSFADDPVKGDATAGFQERYNGMMTALSDDLNAYRKETHMGQEAAQVTAWSARIRERIAALAAYAEK